jgi:tetraacyldisaccharide 4'-kinase
LREPVQSLKRADAVVLTNDASCEGLLIAPYLVWRVRRDIILPPGVQGPCFAFCGIARPQNFFDQLRAVGVTLSATKSYPDHHAYTDADVRRLLALRERHGAQSFLTTEKDLVNLQKHAAALNPLHVIPVQMRLEKADAALNALLTTIAARNRRSA